MTGAYVRFFRASLLSRVPLAFVLLLGCSSATPPADSSYEQIETLSEFFRPWVLRTVIEGDDAALDKLTRESGFDPLFDCFKHMRWAIIHGCAISKADVKPLVLPFMEKLARFTRSRYDCLYFEKQVEILRAWGCKEVRTWRTLLQEYGRISRDETVPVEERIRRMTALVPQLDSLSRGSASQQVRHRLARLYGEAGRHEEALARYRDLVRMCEAAHAHSQMSHFAGVVGAVHPDPDSTLYYYRLGLSVARDHEFVVQQARLLSFIGYTYASRGRFGLAEQYYSDAIGLYDRHPRAPLAWRFLKEAADRYRRLGYFDEAERALDRAELSLEGFELGPRQLGGARAVLLGSRTLLVLARGKAREAETLQERVLPMLESQEVEHATGFMRDYALLQLRQSDLLGCVKTIRQGTGLWPENERLDTYRREMFALEAYVCALLDRNEDVRASLARHASAADTSRVRDGFGSGPDQRILISLARAHLNLEADGADTGAVLDSVDLQLRSALAGAEQGAHRYMWLEQNEIVRDFYRDVAGGDPDQALGIALFWRSLHSSVIPPVQGGLRSTWKRLSGEARRLAARNRGEFLVYSVRGEQVARYLVLPEEVRADRVQTSATEIRALVEAAWRGLSVDPGDQAARVDSYLSETLRRLRRILLPQDLKRGRLMVMGDGALSRLPFEALNLSSDEYEPLLMRHDVVYLRTIDPGAETSPLLTPGVVLADPMISEDVRRRIDRFRPLPGARTEAARVVEYLPGAHLAVGDSATAQWLQRRWEGAEYIHVATHAVEDPRAPFYALLAMAGGVDDVPVGDAFLDIGDVLEADLSACELAVLSGCATGAPHSGSAIAPPSFGDAFLDAGAGEVIQTFWNVRDDLAAETVNLFLKTWHEKEMHPRDAIQRVRRDLADRYPHPYFWAAYFIETSGEPE